MKAAIYTRISLDSTGEGLAVQRQEEDARKIIEQRGWECVQVYSDSISASNNKKHRPGYEALRRDYAAGLFAALVVWDLDRLTRQPRQLEDWIEAAEGRGLALVTTNGEADLTTDGGRMYARIKLAVARAEVERKSAREKRRNEQEAAAGKWHTTNRPFGYTQTGEPLEPEATMVRQAVKDVLTGKSLNQVAREWNAAGVKTTLAGNEYTLHRDGRQGKQGDKITVAGKWDSPRVRRVLMNPRYAGLRVHRRKVVGPGEWEALIDVDTHEGLKAMLKDPARLNCTSFEKKYMGSGVYLCGDCGAPMRHAVAGNPRVRRYECTAKQHVTRRGEPVDETVTELILARLARPHIKLALEDSEPVDVAALQARRAALQAKSEEWAEMFGEDDDIDATQWRKKNAMFKSKIREIDNILGDLKRRSPAAELLQHQGELRDAWEKLSADLKGKVIREVADIRIMPVPKSERRMGFQPELIVPDWKI